MQDHSLVRNTRWMCKITKSKPINPYYYNYYYQSPVSRRQHKQMYLMFRHLEARENRETTGDEFISMEVCKV